MDRNSIYFFKKEDKDFPQLLREIKDCPKKLYYKGNWDKKIFENCLAVVGSRKMTSYGQRVEEQLVLEIASAGITIVSGFMYGGDAIAHKAAIKAGGKTIAVMPCGIDLVHPAHQINLYQKILENNGLIISEYEGKMPPAVWTYPRRNRIIAGLSKAVLIVEAALQSGTLITADFAKKFGRKIFAVPGPITSSVSLGTARLLKEGAVLVTSAKDVLDYFGVSNVSQNKEEKFCDIKGLEKKIVEELKKEPQEIDILVRKIGISASEIGTFLSLMELKGIIEKKDNKYYIC